uniref:Uncharacterized protein n=1 Tax=Vespula pensylvanica TaxID=30213 RepID=A0A834UFJ4_VESPE|nr:hypothetical protein H0235_004024 [Vespula pensylvanica]
MNFNSFTPCYAGVEGGRGIRLKKKIERKRERGRETEKGGDGDSDGRGVVDGSGGTDGGGGDGDGGGGGGGGGGGSGQGGKACDENDVSFSSSPDDDYYSVRMAGVSSWQARQSGTGNELSRRGASWDFSVSSNACGSLRCPATKTSVEKRRESLCHHG